jgi:hypothetical protein
MPAMTRCQPCSNELAIVAPCAVADLDVGGCACVCPSACVAALGAFCVPLKRALAATAAIVRNTNRRGRLRR